MWAQLRENSYIEMTAYLSYAVCVTSSFNDCLGGWIPINFIVWSKNPEKEQ